MTPSLWLLLLLAVQGGKTASKPVIACFGDSLTAGHGLEEGQSYPDFLQKKLPAWRVVNLGVSGDTTAGGLARFATVTAVKPKLVVLELGANDGLRGLPLKATRSNLEQMIVTLQKSGVRVVLAGMTLPPNYGPDYIRDFEKVFKDLATKYKLHLIPFLLEGVAYPGTNLLQHDGLHPNARGTEKVAETVLKAIKPLLR